MVFENTSSFNNKCALITGAASGIGKHFAITLARAGCSVILIDKDKEKIRVTEQQCRKHVSKVLAICADVTILADINAAVEMAKINFSQVDILINSAGIGKVHKDILNLTETEWNSVIDVNLKGVFFVSQAIAKWMLSTKTSGKIINISSAAAYHTTKIRSVYSISKIGVECLMRNFALSLCEYNISVNCIAPGFVETELTEDYLKTDGAKAELSQIPMQRAAKLTELDGVLLLLASDYSSYITGTTIQVDGGCAVNKV